MAFYTEDYESEQYQVAPNPVFLLLNITVFRIHNQWTRIRIQARISIRIQKRRPLNPNPGCFLTLHGKKKKIFDNFKIVPSK